MIPTKWSEVTIGQYQAMSVVLAKKLTDLEQRIALAGVFLGEKANDLTVAKLYEETAKLDFITEFPSEKMFYGFELDGKRYTINVIAQSLTSGQFIDLSNLTKKPEDTIANLHNIMAVISTSGEYEGYSLNGKLFQEKLTMDKVYPASAFFLKVGQGFLKAIDLYLRRENKKAVKMLKSLKKELSTQSPTKSTGDGLSLLIGSEGNFG